MAKHRAMRRTLLALSVAGLLLSSLPATAAGRGDLHVSDPAGDANGINDQELGLGVPDQSTAPASIPGADIIGIDVITLYKKVGKKQTPKGTNVVLRLAGPVMTGVTYVLTATVPSTCDGTNKTIQLGYQDLKRESFPLAICQAPATGGASVPIGVTTVSGSTITWTLSFGLKPGATITDFNATTTVYVVGVFDQCVSSRTYTYAR